MASIMTVRAPDELFKALERAAKSRGFTRNALILQILWDWLKGQSEEEGGRK